MMRNLIMYVEHRFKTINNDIYSSVYKDYFFARYFKVFDKIYVVSRVDISPSKDVFGELITNSNVLFDFVPYYKGAFQFVLRFPWIIWNIYLSTRKEGVHFIRLPGAVGGVAAIFLVLFNKSFCVEVLGDVDEVFSRGKVGGFLSFFYRRTFVLLTKWICKRASAVTYVTSRVLQEKYPSSIGVYTTSCSDVVLKKEHFLSQKSIRDYAPGATFRILAVGSMEQRYKGIDVAINALSRLNNLGYNAELVIVGAGRYKDELQILAESLQQKNKVLFMGAISRDDVLHEMDKADIFVMPSRTEGMPRALIEAMARGMPAIGSCVGGIPELLDDCCLFDSENDEQLASLLIKCIKDINFRKEQSQRNIIKSLEFLDDVLDEKRTEFLRHALSACQS